jgi:hypothetical protein
MRHPWTRSSRPYGESRYGLVIKAHAKAAMRRCNRAEFLSVPINGDTRGIRRIFSPERDPTLPLTHRIGQKIFAFHRSRAPGFKNCDHRAKNPDGPQPCSWYFPHFIFSLASFVYSAVNSDSTDASGGVLTVSPRSRRSVWGFSITRPTTAHSPNTNVSLFQSADQSSDASSKGRSVWAVDDINARARSSFKSKLRNISC